MRKAIAALAATGALALGVAACGGGDTTTVQQPTPTVAPGPRRRSVPAPGDTAPVQPAPQPNEPGPAPTEPVNGWTVGDVKQLIGHFEKYGITPGAATCYAEKIIPAFTPDEFYSLSSDDAYAVGRKLAGICGV